MRILHVIPQFAYVAGRTVIGGHASCLMTLAMAQCEAGHEPTIVAHVHGRGGEIPIAGALRVHAMVSDGRPGTVRFGLQFRREVLAWAAQHRAHFDVVHCHSGFADYFMVSSSVKRAAGLPVVHTMYCPIARARGRARLPIVHGMLRRMAQGLDARVAMSKNVADSMRAYGLRDVEVVPPAVDLHRFHGGREPELRRQLGLADHEVAVLFVGNAKPQKNLSGVLEAMARVRRRHANARLVITTELPQSSSDVQLGAVRRQLRRLNLEASTIQLSIVESMPRLMRACDILVAPFLDTYGPSDYFMAVLEAMASERPTVVSAVGGMPEVIREEFGRLVNPADHEAIARAIEQYVVDAEARESAGRSARYHTERHFEPSAIVGAYDALYRRIAST